MKNAIHGKTKTAARWLNARPAIVLAMFAVLANAGLPASAEPVISEFRYTRSAFEHCDGGTAEASSGTVTVSIEGNGISFRVRRDDAALDALPLEFIGAISDDRFLIFGSLIPGSNFRNVPAELHPQVDKLMLRNRIRGSIDPASMALSSVKGSHYCAWWDEGVLDRVEPIWWALTLTPVAQ